jgi:tRNA modification GTPase
MDFSLTRGDIMGSGLFMQHQSIVAVSSGQGRAAITVVRVSGPAVRFVIETILSTRLEPRFARLVVLRDPVDLAIVDRCLALFFAAPASATGEDVLELHIHGGLAVTRAVMVILTTLPGVRLAEPGEFTRRGLENGKLDVLQVEALGDLLNSETSAQLQQAQRQLSGELGKRALGWRERLTSLRALIEADLDFADEGDVGPDLVDRVRIDVQALADEIVAVLGQAERGARIREGAPVVVVGAPNAGKSQLINALAGRQVGIVSDVAGTTRDVLEAPKDMHGLPVVLVDTAGLRDIGSGVVEREGMRLTRERAASADVVLSVCCWNIPPVEMVIPPGAKLIRVGTKADQYPVNSVDVLVSGLTGGGIDMLQAMIANACGHQMSQEPALVARQRQRVVLEEVVGALGRCSRLAQPELIAEELRHASFALGRLVGQTDLDTVLDDLFHGFCIGK